MNIEFNKPKIFISSKIGVSEDGNRNYLEVRKGLKERIEKNGFHVYLFEDAGASTISVIEDYTEYLKASDFCIFLIDNKDSVSEGVQIEIDIVNKYNIKSLYYFCNEYSEINTFLQIKLTQVNGAKYKVLSKFIEFSEKPANDIVDERNRIYSQYSKGILAFSNTQQERDSGEKNVYIHETIEMNKEVIKSFDKCKNFFSEFLLNQKTTVSKTNELDGLMLTFFIRIYVDKSQKVMWKNLTSEIIKSTSDKRLHNVIKIRLLAIEKYYFGDLNSSFKYMKRALNIARKDGAPKWIIQDLLIDLRNLEIEKGNKTNRRFTSIPYQNELDKDESFFYYPVLDRLSDNFFKKTVQEDIKFSLESPYVHRIGGTYLIDYIEKLTSIACTCLLFGSLTHLLTMHKRFYIFSYYSVNRYSDWILKVNLIKFSIYSEKNKDRDNILDKYNEILLLMSNDDAKNILDFASIEPIDFKQLILRLEAFRIVGYFLNDQLFRESWNSLYANIFEWCAGENSIVSVGEHIFRMIEKNYLRINPDHIIDICISMIISKKRLFLSNIIRTLTNNVVWENVSNKKLVEVNHQVDWLIQEGESIEYELKRFFIAYRKRNNERVKFIDKIIMDKFPDFYEKEYSLEILSFDKDFSIYIDENISDIENRNETQGLNGTHVGYHSNPVKTIWNIIAIANYNPEKDEINRIIIALLNMICNTNHFIKDKIDAIQFITYICTVYKTDKELLDRIKKRVLLNMKYIEDGYSDMTNHTIQLLKFNATLLYVVLKIKSRIDVISALTVLSGDEFSEIHASIAFRNLTSSKSYSNIEEVIGVVLHQSILWSDSERLDVRYYSIETLFNLMLIPEYSEIIANRMLVIFDKDILYIKNIILKNLTTIEKINPEISKYIKNKSKNDSNFVIRNHQSLDD